MCKTKGSFIIIQFQWLFALLKYSDHWIGFISWIVYKITMYSLHSKSTLNRHKDDEIENSACSSYLYTKYIIPLMNHFWYINSSRQNVLINTSLFSFSHKNNKLILELVKEKCGLFVQTVS